ncbi:MAG TPA: plastocyanin/azurin family copper-binding protein [Halococcus sp.]|nr:plastocyanin/azurin family copper-binding protein [Halococcus sp.]
MGDTDGPVDRRGFLRAAAGTAAVAGATGTAAAQEGGSSGGSTKTVTVGPGGSLTFDPDELTIAPGTAVKFVWDSSGHNVHPKSGKWGHIPIEDKGFSYTTPPFKQTGSQKYWCDPHKSAGMIGTITVQQGGASSGGSSGPSVPDNAKTLGIAAMSFMLSTLGLAYFFMKYGEDFETREE